MNAGLDKVARLSRDVQQKIGEKLALLYVPVVRQRVPNRLSELLRRLETTKAKSNRVGGMLRLKRRRPSS